MRLSNFFLGVKLLTGDWDVWPAEDTEFDPAAALVEHGTEETGSVAALKSHTKYKLNK
jgi:hypothetical protein